MKQLWITSCAVTMLVAGGCITTEKMDRQFSSNRLSSYQRLTRLEQQENSDAFKVISGKLTVDKCLELTLLCNKQIQSARAALEEAQGQIVEARATALPIASFSGSALVNENDGLVADKESYELGLLARQPLYLGGLIGAALDAATAAAYFSQQELRQSMQDVQLEVRRQYLGALLAAELERVAIQARNDAKKHLNDVEVKLKHGAGLKFDVLRAQVRLTQMEADLIKRQHEAKLAQQRLLNVLGVSQLSKVELAGKLDYQELIVSDSSCLEQAQLRRPGLLMAEAMVRLREDNIVSEKSGNRPRVYLQGVYQRSYPGFGSFLGDKKWERTMNGGVVVEWPFFSGFAVEGKVTQAKAQLHKEQIALHKLEEQVQFEVTEGLLTLDSSARFVRSQQGNVANAEEALRLVRVSFQEGAATALDVISAELALATARSDYATSVYGHEVARLQLHRAVGTLGEEVLP